MLFNLFSKKKEEVKVETTERESTLKMQESLSKLKQFAKEFEIVAERYNKMVEENMNE